MGRRGVHRALREQWPKTGASSGRDTGRGDHCLHASSCQKGRAENAVQADTDGVCVTVAMRCGLDANRNNHQRHVAGVTATERSRPPSLSTRSVQTPHEPRVCKNGWSVELRVSETGAISSSCSEHKVSATAEQRSWCERDVDVRTHNKTGHKKRVTAASRMRRANEGVACRTMTTSKQRKPAQASRREQCALDRKAELCVIVLLPTRKTAS